MAGVEESPYLTDYDLHLLTEGVHYRNYRKLGAHVVEFERMRGTRFAVWAPNADYVSVIGSFNDWNPHAHPMEFRAHAGIWECFVPGVEPGALYKYHLTSRRHGFQAEKSDPYAFAAELRPRSASVVWDTSGYEWGDQDWMENRAARNALDTPISIYEVHLGSWMRVSEEEGRWLTYREAAGKLAAYVQDMAFTHVELMPVTEHPFDGSWGYQTTGYYAPTSRFGTPQDFMFFVETLHRHGIGVLIDWVPGHFPNDGHGLHNFDGTHLFEHADPRQGQHPEWSTSIFNFGRREVSNFLIGSALFWLDKYHIDGLRVDGVASMLYLDYARGDGEWIPNRYGGKENIEAIEFLRRLNERVYEEFPGVMMVAEESTAWPMVSRPTYLGGLGFGFKWNMGWMHDMLVYMSKDPVHRRYEHEKITFSMLYAFTENFVLPFSHDEVCHGKGAMIGKMPGDEWQRFANLRLLYGYMLGHPGKKLLFMGNEFGQVREWAPDDSLEWHVLQYPFHQGLRRWVRDINRLYRSEPALHEIEFDPGGFEWIDCDDYTSSVVSFLRRGKDPNETVVFVCNFTPVLRETYRIGLPGGGFWRELLNSDAAVYGGSNAGNAGCILAEETPVNGRPYSASLTLPPLATMVLKGE